jgi:hypothetical protein
MLLMHCLAEITDRTLVFEERILWQQGVVNDDCNDFSPLWSPPELAGDYLIHARFDLDDFPQGEVGIVIQQTEDPLSELNLKCVLHLTTGVWQISEVNERNGVKLMEKRGKLDRKASRVIDIYLLSVSGQYFFYICSLDAPVFQCEHAALMSSPRFPMLHIDGHDMPVLASMKIWRFSSRPKGTLSLASLLVA